ncbi:hypothetical protein CDAR_116291 [Caerostris darwini]|uniref:Uncharacterized protein n=1 Tax=Caerostris darwini TaxID=1538125 RepID=A0AAV4WM74_9ARAC|nr:hypothetical protein CDAR_116291 [Caerostris darwini]
MLNEILRGKLKYTPSLPSPISTPAPDVLTDTSQCECHIVMMISVIPFHPTPHPHLRRWFASSILHANQLFSIALQKYYFCTEFGNKLFVVYASFKLTRQGREGGGIELFTLKTF